VCQNLQYPKFEQWRNEERRRPIHELVKLIMPKQYVRRNEAVWIDAFYNWVRQINEEFVETHVERSWREFDYYWQKLSD